MIPQPSALPGAGFAPFSRTVTCPSTAPSEFLPYIPPHRVLLALPHDHQHGPVRVLPRFRAPRRAPAQHGVIVLQRTFG